MNIPSQGPQNILCPVDFSEISALGLRFASALAGCSNARLTVLFADPFLPPPYFTESRLEEMRRRLQQSVKEAEKSLQDFVGKTLGDIRVEVKVVEALPVDGIMRLAREIPADMIAMGTHGRSGVNRLMLGSVAERVLRESHIPVLTVRPVPGGPEPFPAIRNIVCPVNNSEVARRSLRYAARLAHCFDADLIVLHVKQPGAKDSIEDLCAWVPASERSLCSIREMTREGEAAEQIVVAASELPCDLLVMGARHRRFFDSTVIGATTVRVVRHANCAVLTVVTKE
jgi:nucleotide-binding universal stress UspA family protein